MSLRSPGAQVFRYDWHLKPIEEKKEDVIKPLILSPWEQNALKQHDYLREIQRFYLNQWVSDDA